ncbi:hypothetical protein J6590_015537 [Homalodisca vitripennis]|nr:hypothetical protein J6590_015537 [Homalodisca vitripennis]
MECNINKGTSWRIYIRYKGTEGQCKGQTGRVLLSDPCLSGIAQLSSTDTPFSPPCFALYATFHAKLRPSFMSRNLQLTCQ